MRHTHDRRGWYAGVLVAAVIAALTPVTLRAQVVATQAAAAVDRAAAVRELVRREVEKQSLVGLSVAVADDGVIVLEEHAGFADREGNVAAGPGTMYRWASISKPVTAVAAMQLVEAGKLDLDADVRVLVPEFPAKAYVVTCRQLLCHQGGIVHYSNGPVIRTAPAEGVEHPYEDVVVALGTFKESPLVCEPGTKHEYTTHGFMLLSAAVERAAGEKFWALVRDRVAEPSGMTRFRPDYQWESIEGRAVGYRKNRQAEVVRSTDTDVSWKLGGGGFISTVSDLSRFSVALMDHQLVSAETFGAMCTAQRVRDGTATTYGLGLNVGEFEGRAIAAHSGGQEKTSTYLLMFPSERLSVSLMCNTEGASLGGLGREVAKVWLDAGE